MENTQLITLSRQSVLRNQLDVIANNMANINTTGFKGQSLHFAEYVMPVADASSFEPADRAMSYVDMFKTHTNFENGSITTTGNPLDVALNIGEGFFVVQLPDGTEAYTRAGAFNLDNTGQLVTHEGHPVMTDAGPITIAAEDGLVNITRDGTINTELGTKGKLRVVQFDDNHRLEKLGDTLFLGEDAQPVLNPLVIQGAVESSNVYGVTEVTRLIEVTRAYDSTTKVMNDTNDLRQQAINALGKIQA